MSEMRRKMAGMPISAKVRFVREAWEREKRSRNMYLKGDNQRKKLEEADTALDCIADIEKHIRGQA